MGVSGTGSQSRVRLVLPGPLTPRRTLVSILGAELYPCARDSLIPNPRLLFPSLITVLSNPFLQTRGWVLRLPSCLVCTPSCHPGVTVLHVPKVWFSPDLVAALCFPQSAPH